jgi:hypothetical protein
MINNANELLEKDNPILKGQVNFQAYDILDQQTEQCLGTNLFDRIISKRTLINIPTWEGQKEAILRIFRLLKPGGIFMMMEATLQGYQKINYLREKFGINRTNIRWHNNYFDEPRLMQFLGQFSKIIAKRNFSSTYYLGSRWLQPLILKLVKKEPSYDFWGNRAFSFLPSIGNFGIQVLFILQKAR